ncbi:MAG: glycerol dehydrogenase [Hoeflea sp.]|uniref:glycerol dehydrogenase n=1 Tax=Hoeflea sp. TaxID=1940281 RepID=UPI00273068AA|nr:glycerol dehydrogenase [Hoeflea sp.]MDP2119270.1 glycerol dehydrogenase [Hoeflea sp.]
MPAPSLRLFGAPARYLQGPGALDALPEHAARYGSTPLVIGDAYVMKMLGARVEALLKGAGLAPVLLTFDGEITRDAIAALADKVKGRDTSLVIGLGGGKSLDSAKGVAVLLDRPMFTVPTIASNDSPTSASIAIYDDRHVMIAVDRMERNPELVLVDTALIAEAPVGFLLAGIGDAISKKYEADGCAAGTGVTPFGTRPLITSIAIADCCYRTIRAHGVAAVEACKRNEVTPDLEAVVEATVLMSGLGFENGGLSLAHSLTRGIVKTRDAMNAIHGYQIAWALLVQWAAEDRPDAELVDLMEFYRVIGLPCSLPDLGMAGPTDAEIDQMAQWTMVAPHLGNLARPIDAARLAAAIRRVEGLAGGSGDRV